MIRAITVTRTPWGAPLSGSVTFADGREGRWSLLRSHTPEIELRGAESWQGWRRVNSPKRSAAVAKALAEAKGGGA